MVFFIIFFMFALFSTFFYMIGLWYLALLPIAVLIFMLSHWIKNIFRGVAFEILLEKWSLFLIWLLTMIGLSWILFFIWIKEISVYLDLLILNVILRFGSHLFKYEDGKILFEIWAWILVVIILWTCLFSEGFFSFFQAFSLLSCLMLGIYSFLQFIIWIFCPTDEKWIYEIFVLWIVALWSSFIRRFYPAEWVMFAGFVFLALILGGIYFVQHREMPPKQTAKISVRRILAGERIFKKFNIPQWKIILYERIENSPKWFHHILESLNLWLLIYLLLFFFWWVFSSSEVILWIWYWAWIAMFLINVFILKKIWYASDISRFALALIVNFVLYSILLISGSSIETILPFLIVWWFLCQFALFFVDRINLTLFGEKDYIYWTIVTFIASICNVILLCTINLPWQFLFSVIFLYVWAELWVLYYLVRFLQDRKEAIKNAELEEKKILKELVSDNVETEE